MEFFVEGGSAALGAISESGKHRESKKQQERWIAHKASVFGDWLAECKANYELEKSEFDRRMADDDSFRDAIGETPAAELATGGLDFYYGKGVPRDVPKALDYSIAGGFKGDLRGYGAAATILMREYMLYDRAAALAYYGAANNNAYCCQVLGELFSLESYNYYNPYISYEYYLAAASAAGFVASVFKVAYARHHGLGIEYDPAEAVVWYTKIAEKGDVNAQSNLGNLYAELRDFDKAGYWFHEAALRGDEEAAEVISYYQFSKLTQKWSLIEY